MRHRMDCPDCLGDCDVAEMYVVVDSFNFGGPEANAVYALRCGDCIEEGAMGGDIALGPLVDHMQLAAPEMLEALKGMLRKFSWSCEQVDAVRAAIAKAQGR